MEIVIKPATKNEERDAMFRIRQEVFEREWGIALAQLRAYDETALHLIALVEPGEYPVAALTVVDTSGDQQLHEGYRLGFAPQTRAARYTQLAVLKHYRGMDIPVRMILEAHHRFVVPGSFNYTWLLFDARHAASSSLCQWLAFSASEHAFASEYGLSRSLVRDERAVRCKRAIRRVERYFGQTAWPSLPAESQREQVGSSR
jgi:GNAT superfamily N-acetyltransferase